jgi:hypothetical protein
MTADVMTAGLAWQAATPAPRCYLATTALLCSVRALNHQETLL